MPVEEVLGFELWRRPDERDENSAVWYGPEGGDGDVATAVSKIGAYQYQIGQIQNVEGLIEEPEEPFLVTAVPLDLDAVVQGALRIKGDAARRRLDRLDEEITLRMAASIGVGYISERGGDDTWVPSLKDGIAEIT